MMERLSGFPDDVVAIRCGGVVTAQDYERVLMPAVAAALSAHERVRVYYEIGPDFQSFAPGAMWDDMIVGMRHFSRWGRVAVVTDVDWLRHAVAMFGFLFPAGVKVFPVTGARAAQDWLAQAA